MAFFIPTQLEISLTGVSPGQYVSVEGDTFFTTVNIVTVIAPSASVTGSAFTQAPKINGGGVVRGDKFRTSPTLTLNAPFTAYVTGRNFRTSPVITAQGIAVANISGASFKGLLSAVGGAVVSGTGLKSIPAIGYSTSELIRVSGNGFKTSPIISSEAIASIRVTGGTFVASLFRAIINGSTFTQSPIITTEKEYAFSEAFVMNVKTNKVSRYQNFPFKHIARVGDQYVGLTAEGIYLLDGIYDIDVEVNGAIHSKAFDFGMFNSKNVPYMYINGDDTYTVKAYVDRSQQPSFESRFSGRRVKLARGNKGRYWSFEISGINKLQGIEFMPEQISRRVK